MGAVPAALLAFYRAHELPGIFLFLLIEEMGLPLIVPGDALIAAAGARGHRTTPEVLLVILVAAAAAALGSSVLYTLVRRGGQPLLARYGRYLHLTPERVATMERRFRRHGALAIVVGRLVPGLRTPTTVMAGLFGVPYCTFAPATAAAAVAWATLYYVLGAALERAWREVLLATAARAQSVAAVAVALAVVASAAAMVWTRRARWQTPPGG